MCLAESTCHVGWHQSGEVEERRENVDHIIDIVVCWSCNDGIINIDEDQALLEVEEAFIYLVL